MNLLKLFFNLFRSKTPPKQTMKIKRIVVTPFKDGKPVYTGNFDPNYDYYLSPIDLEDDSQ